MEAPTVDERLPDERYRDRKQLVCGQVSRLGYTVKGYRVCEDTGREQVELADGWHFVGDLLAVAGGKP